MHSSFPISPGLRSAEESAKARRDRAKGDSVYTWRPQVSFSAQYGRISPYQNVETFYNLHGNYNTASIGVQIQFPLLDLVRRAAAAESTADARRSDNELLGLRFDEQQGRRKLLRSLPELSSNAELAEVKVEQKIAENELSSALLQMKQSSGGPPVTPKEEMNARIQERQKYLMSLTRGCSWTRRRSLFFVRLANLKNGYSLLRLRCPPNREPTNPQKAA